MKHAETIELAPFAINPKTTEADLLQASDRLDDFLRTLDGFRGRLLLKKNDIQWLDIVFWRSSEDAEAMMKKMEGNPVCAQYFACMQEADHDDPAAGVTMYRRIKAY